MQTFIVEAVPNMKVFHLAKEQAHGRFLKAPLKHSADFDTLGRLLNVVVENDTKTTTADARRLLFECAVSEYTDFQRLS